MSIIAISLGLLGFFVLGACLWQHSRYLKIRREIVQDQQPMLYPGQTFHAVIYLKVESGEDVIGAARSLRPVLESSNAGTIAMPVRLAVRWCARSRSKTTGTPCYLFNTSRVRRSMRLEIGRSSGGTCRL